MNSILGGATVALYNRLKASRLYDCYWQVVDSRILERRDAEIAFYRALLGTLRAGDLIFDVGANHGYKSDMFLRMGARVVAIEPDAMNQEILRWRFQKLRIFKKPLTIVGMALSDRDGLETMWVERPGSAKNTLSSKWVTALAESTERFGEALTFPETVQVRTCTLDALMAQYGKPRFLKIDVEGYEASVLAGLSTPIPDISFEANLPEFLSEAQRCIEIINGIASTAKFNMATPSLDSGWLLPAWVDATGCRDAMSKIKERCVEVFARTT